MVDTEPLSAPSLSTGTSTGWLDKAYFTIVKDTMVAGREYTLTLAVKDAAGECEATATRLIQTNTAPRLVSNITILPVEKGVEFNTSYTVDCGTWVDTDETLSYRLQFWYNFDAFAPRWTWLTPLQSGSTVFPGVMLPYSDAGGGVTEVRCVAYDDEGAFGYGYANATVAEHPELAAAVDELFLRGSHTERLEVFPAALRRLQQIDKANNSRRRRGLLGTAPVGIELQKALGEVASVLNKSTRPTEAVRDAVLELAESYAHTPL
jgi:hypothetical protein